MAEERRIEDELAYPILLAERIRAAVDEAESFKLECSEMGKQVDRISNMLRSVVRLSTSVSSLYERPIRRVVAQVSKNFERTLTLIRQCKRQNFLRRVFAITSLTDFRKIFNLLDASVGDMKWLLSIYDYDGGNGDNGGRIVLSLPPIASMDPILSWVWSFVASVQMGQLPDRIEAGNELASLAEDNRNKKIIVEEGGVPPLLKLLKDGVSPEGQIAAALALYNLANDEESVRVIANELGVPVVVQVLGDSPTKVQIMVAKLAARMAKYDRIAQEDFDRENAIRPLVTLLSFETFADDSVAQSGKQSIHSVVEINKEIEKISNIGSSKHSYSDSYSNSNSYSSLYAESGSRAVNFRKERENEKSELKLELKINCSEALWMLARNSVSNSRRITETKGLLCLAKLVEKEQGELQYNCLMTIMEITAAAESNADLRRAAFKTNSPAAKAVVEQLLRVIKELDSPSLQIPAIQSIGSLARTFPARETRVIHPLVTQLNHKNHEVATQAAIALGKFTCPENFLFAEHSKAIIDFNGIQSVMRLLRGSEWTQCHGLTLLCYLALHSSNSESLEQARVMNVLEGADRSAAAQHPELRELVSKAIYHLNVYHAGLHSERWSYV